MVFSFQASFFAQNRKAKSSVPGQVNQSGVIAEDTVLSMRMDTPLNSKTSRVGDKFTATVTVPVYVDGKEAIPAGTIVEGIVTQVTPARRMNKGGSIAVEFEEIILPNGLSTKIDGILTSDDPEVQKKIDDENRVSGGKSKDTLVFVGQTGAIGAVLGAIGGGGKGAAAGGAIGAGIGLASVLFSKGEEAYVNSGTPFGIRLKQALPVPDDTAFANNSNTANPPIDNSNAQSNFPTSADSTKTTDRNLPDEPAKIENPTPENSTPKVSDSAKPTSIEDHDLPDAATETMPLDSPVMIQRAQQALKEKGYYEGEMNGELTPRTERALRVFQKENQLDETGSLDEQTARKLGIINGQRRQPGQSGPVMNSTTGVGDPRTSTPQNRSSARENVSLEPSIKSSATTIQNISMTLLSDYQRMIGARVTDNGVEYENGSHPSDADVDLLFSLEAFSNAAKLFNRIAPSLRSNESLRNATLNLAKEGRRTDKVLTTSSSRWVNQLNPQWDALRQEVLKLMQTYNIQLSEIEN
ncbi:MAG: peptidoglycan-binding protein [Acidobacteriota bacterium]